MLVETFVELEGGVEVRVTIEARGGDSTELRAGNEVVATLGVTEEELLAQANVTANAVLGLHKNQGRRATRFDQVQADIVPPHPFVVDVRNYSSTICVECGLTKSNLVHDKAEGR